MVERAQCKIKVLVDRTKGRIIKGSIGCYRVDSRLGIAHCIQGGVQIGIDAGPDSTQNGRAQGSALFRANHGQWMIEDAGLTFLIWTDNILSRFVS